MYMFVCVCVFMTLIYILVYPDTVSSAVWGVPPLMTITINVVTERIPLVMHNRIPVVTWFVSVYTLNAEGKRKNNSIDHVL